MDIVELGIKVTSEGVDKANKSLRDMPHAAGLAEKSIESLTDEIKKLAAAYVSFEGLKSAVGIMVDFDSKVKATANLTGTSFELIKSLAMESAIATNKYAGDVASAFGVIGSKSPALLENVSALQAVTNESLELAEAATATGDAMTDMEAAGAITSLLNSYSVSAANAAAQSDRFGDALAAAAQVGSVSISNLTQTIAGVGTSFALAGVGAEELLGVAELLGEKSDKLQGAEAATALNAIVIKLQTAKDEFEKFGVTGVDVALSQDGLAGALRRAQPLLNDNAALVKVFGTEHANAVKIMLSNIDGIEEYTRKITGTDTATTQAAAGMESLSRQASALGSNIKNIIAGIGGDFFSAPALESLKAVNGYLVELQTNSRSAEIALTTLTTAAGALAARGLAPVITGMYASAAATMAKASAVTALTRATTIATGSLNSMGAMLGGPVGVAIMGGILAWRAYESELVEVKAAGLVTVGALLNAYENLRYSAEMAITSIAGFTSGTLGDAVYLAAEFMSIIPDANPAVSKSLNEMSARLKVNAVSLEDVTAAHLARKDAIQDELNAVIESKGYEDGLQQQTAKLTGTKQELADVSKVAAGATEGLGKAQKEAAKAADDLKKKQSDLNASLKEQIATFGMSSAESRRWKAENEKLLTEENDAQLKKLEALEQEEEQRITLWELDKQLSEQFIADVEYATQAQIEQADKLNQAYGDVFNSLAGAAASFFNSLGKGKIDIGGILSQGASGLQSAAISGMTEAVKGGGIDALFKTGGGNFISEALGGLSGLLSNSSSSMLQSAGGLLGKGASWAATMSPLTSGLLGFAAPIALDAITNMIGNMGSGPYSGKGFKVSGSLQDFQLAALTQNNKGSKTDILDTSAGTFGKWNISDVLSGRQSLGQDQLKALLGVEDTIKAFGKGITDNIDFIGKAFGQDLATNFSENFDASLNIEGENFENALSVWLQETGGKAIDFARDNIDTSKLDEAGKLLFEISSAFDFNADAMKAAKSAIESISENMNILEIDSSKLGTALVNAAGGMASLQAGLDFFYQQFTTSDEKISDATNRVSNSLKDLGLELPKTRDEFKAMYKAADPETLGKLTTSLEDIDAIYDSRESSEREMEKTINSSSVAIDRQVQAYDTATSAQENYIDSLMKGAESLNDWIMQQLTGSDSAATFSQQFALAQAEFNRVSSMGSQASAQDLQRSAETLLQLNRQGFGARGAGLEAQVLSQVHGIAAGMGGGSNEAVVALLQQLLDATQAGNADNTRQLRRMSDTRRRV